MNIEMLAVTPEGELRDVTVANEAEVFPALRQAIDCQRVIPVGLAARVLAWVVDNEHGAPRGLTPNVYGTVAAQAFGWDGEVLVGTIVFSGPSVAHTTSLPAELRDQIADIVIAVRQGLAVMSAGLDPATHCPLCGGKFRKGEDGEGEPS